MFNFPNKTAQKMWNLIRLGLHDLQTPQDLVIKENHKNKTANSGRHELNYLPDPKIEAQITSSKQGNRRNFQNFPQFKHPEGKQSTKAAENEQGITRSACTANSSSSEPKARADFASGSTGQSRCPHAPGPSSELEDGGITRPDRRPRSPM
jgi:hypothetical protein